MGPTDGAVAEPGDASPGNDLRSVGRWADWQRAELEDVARRLRAVLAEADAAAEAAVRAAGPRRSIAGAPLTVDELARVVDCVLTAARVRAEGGVPRGWGGAERDSTSPRPQPDGFEW